MISYDIVIVICHIFFHIYIYISFREYSYCVGNNMVVESIQVGIKNWPATTNFHALGQAEN